VRAPWRSGPRESAGRRALLAPLSVAGALVGAGARLHRLSHERGWRPVRRLPCGVVSVGNLVLGGTGKTPTAAWLASRLRERGWRVALASRGYGRRAREPVTVVSDGRRVRSDALHAGDEPLVLAARAPGVPVLVGRDRGLVGLRAVAAFDTEVLVLDDGFQHHGLARDAELLTVDGGLGFGNRRVFPRGPLREPPTALGRVHAVLVVDGPLAPDDEAWLARHAPGARRGLARRQPVSLRPLAGGARGAGDALRTPPGALRGLPVGVLASLARPETLLRHLERLGARVAALRLFRDHHRYRARDLRGLAAEAPRWITTEKDAVKIDPSWTRGVDLRVLELELVLEEPAELLDWLEERLRAAGAAHAGSPAAAGGVS